MNAKHIKELICLFFVIGVFSSDVYSNKNTDTESPNFLFIIADDIGRELLGAYGCEYISTPNIDNLSEKGLLFTNAFTTNGKCSPSRASILSGRYFFQNEDAAVHGTIYPRKLGSYQQVLEENGYHTGHTGKGWAPGDWEAGGWMKPPSGNSYNSELYAPGYDIRVGFRDRKIPVSEYKDVNVRAVGNYTPEQMKELIFSGNVWNIDYSANFEKFLKEKPEGKSFSFWYGSNDGHQPWLKGSGKRFNGNLNEVKVPPFYPDCEDIRGYLLDIGVEVELFDAEVGEAIKLLKKYNLYDNTVIVITSDNGTEGVHSKGDTYINNCNMPLVMIYPLHIKPGKCDKNICFSDFAPTFLELAGIEIPSSMTGQSFADLLLKGEDNETRKPMFHGRENYGNYRIYPARSIKKGDFYYIRNYYNDIRYPSGLITSPKVGDEDIPELPYEGSILQNIIDQKKAGVSKYWNWCYEKRPKEELYDLSVDPFCLTNLADQASYKKIKEKMASALHQLLIEENDPRELGDESIIKIWDKDKLSGMN